MYGIIMTILMFISICKIAVQIQVFYHVGRSYFNMEEMLAFAPCFYNDIINVVGKFIEKNL